MWLRPVCEGICGCDQCGDRTTFVVMTSVGTLYVVETSVGQYMSSCPVWGQYSMGL